MFGRDLKQKIYQKKEKNFNSISFSQQHSDKKEAPKPKTLKRVELELDDIFELRAYYSTIELKTFSSFY